MHRNLTNISKIFCMNLSLTLLVESEDCFCSSSYLCPSGHETKILSFRKSTKMSSFLNFTVVQLLLDLSYLSPPRLLAIRSYITARVGCPKSHVFGGLVLLGFRVLCPSLVPVCRGRLPANSEPRFVGPKLSVWFISACENAVFLFACIIANLFCKKMGKHFWNYVCCL